MLRIRYKNRETVFEFRNIKRAKALNEVASHRFFYRTETVTIDGREVERKIDPADMIVEWQDGDGDWNPAAPIEVIPVPGQ